MGITRRMFLGLAALGSATGGYSFAIEPSWLRIKEYNLESLKWPKGAKPLKIAFASDFHVGCPSVGLEEAAHIVDKINALNADIIFLGGDYLIRGVVLGEYIPPKPIVDILKKLSAPLGVFAVLGNHDWWKDGAGIWNAMKEVGFTVLENSAARVTQDGYDFYVAGLADDTTRRPDYRHAMLGIPDDVPVLMMAHDPASFDGIESRPVLTLSGHTHGGQVVVPFIGPIVIPGRAPLKYAYGHIVEEERDLIVSSGLGTSILPVRFGRRPEIVSVTISAA